MAQALKTMEALCSSRWTATKASHKTLCRFLSGLAKTKQEMSANKGDTKEQQEFVTSCILALDGVQKYMQNFGFLAGYLAQKTDFAFSDSQRENLKKVMDYV